MSWEYKGKKLEVVQGDIASQRDIDAVVNAANAQLETGGGVAGALHRAAGPELAEAGRKHAPINPGEAVITPAFQLPNSNVIHCLGPVYGQDTPEDELLKNCYEKTLYLGEKEKQKSIAFPAISTGAFGFPFEKALDLAVDTVFEVLPELEHVEFVRFVLFSSKEAEAYKKALEKKLG
ncbi:MAG: macro domain-containing protein [Alkalicoccus sp.]|nr:MAG: macro domain-containing protein [Alkalicoccus sp.]